MKDPKRFEYDLLFRLRRENNVFLRLIYCTWFNGDGWMMNWTRENGKVRKFINCKTKCGGCEALTSQK